MKKFLAILVKISIFFIGWALIAGLTPIPEFQSPVVWRFFAELIPLIIIIGFTLVFWLVEKRKIALHLIKNPLKSFVIGSCVGIVWIGITVLILFVVGIIEKISVNSISMLWIWITSVFVNACMQELLVRGYIYQVVKRDYNVIVATVVSTCIFAFMHGGAFEAGVLPVLNIITMSILMTVLLEYTDSLIAPLMAHFIWNGVGGIVVGGISLADDYPRIINMKFSGSSILSGGVYRFEGSIVVLALNIIFCLIFLIPVMRQKAILERRKVKTNETNKTNKKYHSIN